MGQILTQQKLSVVPEIETFLYKYQPQLQFYKNMSINFKILLLR